MNYDWFRRYRVVPVIMSVLMAMYFADVWLTYKALLDPSDSDRLFVTGQSAAVIAWFKFYVNSGSKTP